MILKKGDTLLSCKELILAGDRVIARVGVPFNQSGNCLSRNSIDGNKRFTKYSMYSAKSYMLSSIGSIIVSFLDRTKTS